MPENNLADRVRSAFRIDLSPTERPPAFGRFAVAALVSLVGSIGVDMALVAIGTHVFPSTKGYSHFRLSDYGTLTLIGVAVATLVWPLATRITSTPRWLLFRLAVVATIVLWLPDVYLFLKNEPPRAVVVLMAMHLAIALVTYNALVHLSPTRSPTDEGMGRRDGELEATQTRSVPSSRALWMAMLIAVSVEFSAGVVALLFVPASRPSGWIPTEDRAIYLVHGVFGVAVFVGAILTFAASRAAGRKAWFGAIFGFVGVVLGVIGGLFAVDHAIRLLGMGLMFVGSGVAFCGYLVPLVETSPTSLDEHEPSESAPA